MRQDEMMSYLAPERHSDPGAAEFAALLAERLGAIGWTPESFGTGYAWESAVPVPGLMRHEAEQLAAYLRHHSLDYTRLIDLSGVETLDDLLECMDPKAYMRSNGSYGDMPTWGPETARVHHLIAASCGDVDIVSWDTRTEPHRYLMRHMDAERPVFRIETDEWEDQ